ncbi:hypothetical protein BDP27DRAFT_1333567 [Rhodocollybia butyracea]|uniref:Uncharacterized protein n=1 Tax=Rhodocollybia butyracea TaxID=206335 RepID=A0A9P5U474_9AGAR|nr:hypothetical protein BDP27DRAFT_1333567 [Rhodocollybia butyracea]
METSLSYRRWPIRGDNRLYPRSSRHGRAGPRDRQGPCPLPFYSPCALWPSSRSSNQRFDQGRPSRPGI